MADTIRLFEQTENNNPNGNMRLALGMAATPEINITLTNFTTLLNNLISSLDSWHEVASEYATGWEGGAAAPSYDTNLKYKKIGLGKIQLIGSCRQVSGSSNLILTLPVGYRPDAKIEIPTGAGTSLYIDTLGGVYSDGVTTEYYGLNIIF